MFASMFSDALGREERPGTRGAFCGATECRASQPIPQGRLTAGCYHDRVGRRLKSEKTGRTVNKTSESHSQIISKPQRPGLLLAGFGPGLSGRFVLGTESSGYRENEQCRAHVP